MTQRWAVAVTARGTVQGRWQQRRDDAVGTRAAAVMQWCRLRVYGSTVYGSTSLGGVVNAVRRHAGRRKARRVDDIVMSSKPFEGASQLDVSCCCSSTKLVGAPLFIAPLFIASCSSRVVHRSSKGPLLFIVVHCCALLFRRPGYCCNSTKSVGSLSVGVSAASRGMARWAVAVTEVWRSSWRRRRQG